MLNCGSADTAAPLILDSGRVHTSELAPLPHGMLYNGP